LQWIFATVTKLLAVYTPLVTPLATYLDTTLSCKIGCAQTVHDTSVLASEVLGMQ